MAIKSENVLSRHFLNLAVPEVRAVFREVLEAREDFRVQAAVLLRKNAKLFVRIIRKNAKIFIRRLADQEADPAVDFLAAAVLAVPAAVSLLMNVWRIARNTWMNVAVLARPVEECQVASPPAKAEDFRAVAPLAANFPVADLMVNFQEDQAVVRAKKNVLLIARIIRKIAEAVAPREADKVAVDFLVNPEILEVLAMRKSA